MANEKRMTDATPDDCIRKVKRKTNFARIIVSGTAEKPYYEIVWFNYMDGQYHIGYGSYNLNFVFQWLSECFEIEDAPTVDAVEVVHGRWIDSYAVDSNGKKVYDSIDCSVCEEVYKIESHDREYWKGRFKRCFCCGAKMDGDGNGAEC